MIRQPAGYRCFPVVTLARAWSSGQTRRLATVATTSLLLTVMLISAAFAQVVEGQLEVTERPLQGGNLINDVDQSKVALHPATPYIEQSTLLIADFDLEKFNVEATSSWLNEMFGGAEGDGAAAMARGFVDSLKGAGVSHLYVTAATRSIVDGGPLVIVPCENPAVVQGLATVILQNAPKDPAQKVHMGDKVVLVGAAKAVDRVVASDGISRPDLILPLTAEDRLDHNIVIALPQQTRRDLVALWPDRLPDQSPLQFSPREIVADVSQIIVSLRLPPDPLMVVHVETTDAAAAGRVEKVLEDLIGMAGDVSPPIEIDVEIEDVTLRGSPEAFLKVAQAIAMPARKRASNEMVTNSMKQVGLAIFNYYDNEKSLPPLYYASPDGTPLLSGRVALLPYLEQQALFGAFQLDQAWNSEANMRASSTLVPVYCRDPQLGPKTTIRFPVYPGSLWHGAGPPKDFRDVTDGTSLTIAAIDAPQSAAVEWANPQPWVLSEEDPMSDVFGDRETATVVFLDGAARELKKSEMTNDKLKAMLTIAAGD